EDAQEMNDGDVLEFTTMSCKVMHTPGHTAGGVSLLIEDRLFSGDTLFKGSMGRSDLPSGNQHQLFKSLVVLSKLDEKTVVYAGHGASSTIGEEKASNQFLNFAVSHYK
ncbi:MAG: MBL fold metallo-hydrolase, partial [Coriobacteriia bacterium]|nr:MBL fold metallo-hydrolase [Coriobacteriia bacterium]